MSDNYFLGVDVGSASVRAALFNATGERLGCASRPISQFHASGERVEQSSTEIWQALCAAVREAVGASGVPVEAIRAIGFDATCSLVALDAHGHGVAVSPGGEPSHDIIMWMDHRALKQAQQINASQDPALRYVGGEVSVEMALPKLLWLKQQHPTAWQRTHRFWDLADFLVWQATGVEVASLCTLTCKWNYLAHEGRFSDSLLAAADLADLRDKLPARVAEVATAAGTLSAQAAEALGLTTRTTVATGMIDAHAGGVALAGAEPEGTLALISGTSNCLMLASRHEIHTPGVWGPYWGAMLPEYWLAEGGQSAAGALVEWTLGEHHASAGLFAQAKQQGCHPVEIANQWVAQLEQAQPCPTAHLHVLADHHGNRSPRSRPDARGSVCGLTLERGEQALARLYLATLQAIAYGTRHIIEALEAQGHRPQRIALCGGARHNPLWLREYADATQRDLHLIAEEEAVALGAAICGAVAANVWPDIATAARALVRPGTVIRHRPATLPFHQRKYRVYLAMWEQQQALEALMQQEA
ncbi:FGGY-family carbohydrate kinase [Nissabacter sp. SGAir0207]|uniref:FGGY-family carbohydrate kinase n=1 Tax=Nissabacter sp. SGAir0207 TaxID=2126321 RepID=UPI0010CD18D8|nr:FGGY-family carbohydrate kinase [Nissabacter sp. SGAir0207]QCR35339.1 sugar kinase [Nissabacter sp. SGAir0207]